MLDELPAGVSRCSWHAGLRCFAVDKTVDTIWKQAKKDGSSES